MFIRQYPPARNEPGKRLHLVDPRFLDHIDGELGRLRASGLFKTERVVASPQGPTISVGGRSVINLCANNYLGLAGDARLVASAKEALASRGFGLSSVRFICGTQDLHRTLEERLSRFLGTEDTLLYSSCFDANGGLFETLLSEEDAVITDALNHASIIDGIRLCKARRLRYANNDLHDLEAQLVLARDARFRLIATDGVFSMDGSVAQLSAICDLADQHRALVMVDDSHAVGFVGAHGRGTPELCGVMGRVDLLTGTLGKALGGASGGYTSGRAPLIAYLRQRSRPYLFSNTLMPAIAAASITALDLIEQSDALRERLTANATLFRQGLDRAGFTLLPGDHPIIPVMLYDAPLASRMADRLLEEGVYVIGFSHPVVPLGKARIRTQVSAAHTEAQLTYAIDAFTRVGRELGVVGT